MVWAAGVELNGVLPKPVLSTGVLLKLAVPVVPKPAAVLPNGETEGAGVLLEPKGDFESNGVFELVWIPKEEKGVLDLPSSSPPDGVVWGTAEDPKESVGLSAPGREDPKPPKGVGFVVVLSRGLVVLYFCASF